MSEYRKIEGCGVAWGTCEQCQAAWNWWRRDGISFPKCGNEKCYVLQHYAEHTGLTASRVAEIWRVSSLRRKR